MNRLDRSSGGTYPEDLAENQTHGQRIITALRRGAMSVQELVDVLDGPTYGVLNKTLARGLNKNWVKLDHDGVQYWANKQPGS